MPPLIIKPEDLENTAGEVLRNFTGVHGCAGVIAFPTETFYGLCVDPFNKSALEKLFKLKGRAFDKPVGLIIKNRAMLEQVVTNVPPAAEKLIKEFWPAPLTIVFNAATDVPDLITAGTGKVGVRVSSCAVAAGLVNILDSPITATSANPSGKPPARTAAEVLDYFGPDIDVIIETERPLTGGLGSSPDSPPGSTVIDVTGKDFKILRQGVIPASKLI